MGSVSRHSRFSRPRLNQRGDTIVEVMISLIVISTILTGAFLVSRTSSQNIRSSQEHTEALQLLQGQVEMLRSQASDASSALPAQLANNPSGTFCYSDSGDIVTGDACQSRGNGGLYGFTIQQDPSYTSSSSGMHQFIFSVDWDRLGGGANHESLVYRLPVAS